MRYGFIGLGHLGAQLAGSLLCEGFPLTVTDLNRDPAVPLLARGARWADSPRAVARECDAVFTCLPSPAVWERVLCGPDGILAGLQSGGAWIEMSTLGREEILRLATKAAEKGVATLEAPVTGGVRRGRRDYRAGRRRQGAVRSAPARPGSHGRRNLSYGTARLCRCHQGHPGETIYGGFRAIGQTTGGG